MTKPHKPYLFTLMDKKHHRPIAIYIGDRALPEDVVNHEYSTRQMVQILADYGYKPQRYY